MSTSYTLPPSSHNIAGEYLEVAATIDPDSAGPPSPSRSAMDGVEWRDHAQRSFLSLDDPTTPTFPPFSNSLDDENSRESSSFRKQWSPSSPSSHSHFGSYSSVTNGSQSRLHVANGAGNDASASTSSSFYPISKQVSPSQKNTRGSRLGQQMGMKSKMSAVNGRENSVRSKETHPSQRLEMALARSEEEEPGQVAPESDKNSQYRDLHGSFSTSSSHDRLGAAFTASTEAAGGASEENSWTSFSEAPYDGSRRQPSSQHTIKQKKLSRLQYHAHGPNGFVDDHDRAHRLAQNSIGSVNTAFRRTQLPSPSEGRTPSSLAHYDSAGASTPEKVDSFSSKTHNLSGRSTPAQRELLLPAITQQGLTVSKPESQDAGTLHFGLTRDLQAGETRVQGDSHLFEKDIREGLSIRPLPSKGFDEASRNAPPPKPSDRETQGQNLYASGSQHQERQSSPARSQWNNQQPTLADASAGESSRAGSGSQTKPLTDLDIVSLGAVPGQDPVTLLPANGAPLSSKNVLTIALAKAQSAVQHDSSNSVVEAIEAYGQAVRLLQEVMQRITPRAGSTRKSSREEERRRLKVIHDTYADRIRLLSSIYGERQTGASIANDSPFNHKDAAGNLKAAKTTLAEQPPPSRETAPKNGPVVAIQQGAEKVEAGEDDRIGQDAGENPAKEPEELLRRSDEIPRGRSDSEGSFRSAGSSGPVTIQIAGPAEERTRLYTARQSTNKTQARTHRPEQLLVPKDRNASPSFTDDLIPPSTPYFDAEATLGISNQSQQTGDRSVTAVLPTKTSATGSDDTILAQASAGEGRQKSPAATAAGVALRTNGSPNLLDSGRYSPLGTSTGRPRAITLSSASTFTGKNDDHGATLPESSDGISDRGRLERPQAGADDSSEMFDRSDATTFVPPTSASPLGTSQPTPLAAASSSGIASSLFSNARKRALSQPGGRRPALPAVLQAPPLPKFARKISTPSLNNAFLQQQRPQPSPIVTQTDKSAPAGHSLHTPSTTRDFRFPSPAPSASSGYHALADDDLGEPLRPSRIANKSPNFPILGEKHESIPLSSTSYQPQAESVDANDLFPSGLVSMQILGAASFTHSKLAQTSPLAPFAPPLALQSQTPALEALPGSVLLRPFTQSRLISGSLQEDGSLISAKMFVTPPIWSVSQGIKIAAAESRCRLIDAVTAGVDVVDKAGHHLLYEQGIQPPGLAAVQAASFAKSLEEFENILNEVQNSLSKKLSFIEAVAGQQTLQSGLRAQQATTSSIVGGTKKPSSGVAGFSNLGSKLTRSFDRMALATSTAKSQTDQPASAYFDSLVRCLDRAQVLEMHLVALLRSKRSPGSPAFDVADIGTVKVHTSAVEAYAELPNEVRKIIEGKLRRTSDFYANVIVRFTLRDLSMFVDKAVKRAGATMLE